MKKKFKVRIKYYLEGEYTVQYAHYYLIPVYNNINFWFNQLPTSGTEGWTTDFFSYQKAEKLAESLKSIEDVNNYYKPEIAKRNRFYKQKAEYYKKNVPYKTKYY